MHEGGQSGGLRRLGQVGWQARQGGVASQRAVERVALWLPVRLSEDGPKGDHSRGELKDGVFTSGGWASAGTTVAGRGGPWRCAMGLVQGEGRWRGAAGCRCGVG